MLIAGCQSTDPLSAKNDPRSEWWELAFTEPDYLKVWVETSSVQDITGKVFSNSGGGTAAGGEPDDGTESARGWAGVGGSGTRVVGADLPVRIYVRWQSIVEQKTWHAWVDIPEQGRQLMVSSVNQRCPQKPEQEARFMASVYWGWPPVGSCRYGSETHAITPSKLREHRLRSSRWVRAKARTKGVTLIR